MPRPLLPAVLLLSLALLAACESKVTLENYERIEPGMTLAQVEKILGSGTEESPSGGFSIGASSTLSTSGSQQRIFVWKEEGRQIVVTFENGKVLTKYHKGL